MKTSPLVLFGILLSVSTATTGQTPKVKVPQTPAPAVPADVPPGRADDEKAIRAVIETFVQSFNKGDAKAITALFTEQGEAIDSDGNAIRGRDALLAHYTERFADAPGDKIETSIELIHFLAPEVVRQDGRSRLTSAGDDLPDSFRYTATFVKSQGRWQIASIRDLEDLTISPHERLRELEWMVGDWIEETGDAMITTTVAWTEDKNFLIRSYEIKINGKSDHKGTQRIGWDPLTRQIKSWVFDSQGGYGDGLWTRSGDEWVIKSTGVHPDGLTSSATQTLTRLNKDRLLWKSSDRTLGGEHRDDDREIMMVRKPPEPK